ncbi:MAG: acyl-CoA thioesterase [Acidimicrobiia bacterium]
MADRLTDLLHIHSDDGTTVRIGPVDQHGPFLFGGLSTAMAIRVAAERIDDHLVPLSVRMNFVRAARWEPIDVTVYETNTTRAFAGRRLEFVQDGRVVIVADVTFHVPEEGVEIDHEPAVDMPRPDDLKTIIAGGEVQAYPMELKLLRGDPPPTPQRVHPYWSRALNEIPDTPVWHAAALGFTSDYLVIHAPFEPGTDEGAALVSLTLEHSVTFHRPFRADGWLLFDALPVVRSGGRVYTTGSVHDEQLRRVASIVQTGFIRPRK